MRKNGPGVHSARRRGNDFAHFGRFTGRVCNRTALRGTFSAFASGQVVWQSNAANPLWSSTANAENRPCRSFCPPTRQRFRPLRALCRTRLHPYGLQRHIFRICVLASSLAPRNGKSTVLQGFHLRDVESGTLDNDLLSPSPLSFRHSQSLSSCHSACLSIRPAGRPCRRT